MQNNQIKLYTVTLTMHGKMYKTKLLDDGIINAQLRSRLKEIIIESNHPELDTIQCWDSGYRLISANMRHRRHIVSTLLIQTRSIHTIKRVSKVFKDAFNTLLHEIEYGMFKFASGQSQLVGEDKDD